MKFNIFSKTTLVKASNFFDYPSKDKKKIIKKAISEANKEQKELVKRYDYLFCGTK